MNRLLQGFVFLTASMFVSVAVAQIGAEHRIDIVEVGSTTETMTLSPPIAQDGEFSFDLYQRYTGAGSTSGLGVRIHYDSKVLEPVELSYVNTGMSALSPRTIVPEVGVAFSGKGFPDIISDVTADYDSDATTNRYYRMNWADGTGSLFTEDLPSRLVTAKFKWIGTRTGTTTIALSRQVDTGPQGSTFASNSPVNIEPTFDSPTVPSNRLIAGQILALGETRTIQLTAGTTTGNFNFVDADTAELGYRVDSSADDKVRATITANNEVLLEALGAGTAVITVFAQQGGNPEATQAFEVTVDATPPVITLVGSARLAIRKDSVYVDAGVFAKDNIDGNIRALPIRTITFNGGSVDAVDTKKVGVYIITYNISDAAGNPATPVTRMVEVTGGINIGNNGPTAIAGNKIIIFFYEKLTITGTVTSDFMVSGAPPDTLVTGLDLEDFGYTLALTLSNNIAKNAAVKLAYMKTTGSISGAFSGVVLKNFSDERVITDNIPAIAPEVETAQVNEDRTAIILTFDKDIILNNVSNSRFTVVTNRGTEDRTSVPVTGLSVTGKVLTVSLDTATATATAIERSTVTLSYNLPTAGQTGITGTGVDGGVVTAFQRIMTTGPAVDTPTITPPAVTLVNTESLTLSGMGRAGSNVQLCRDVVFSVGSATVDANRDWTIEVMLVGDENSITVQPEGDCLPAVQGRSEAIVIVQDTFPPSGPVIQTVAQTFNVAPTSINIEGTADAGSTVELFRGAESIGTATVTGGTTTVTGGTTTTGGSWTISVTSLNEGANVFKATATDAAGNVSIDYQTPPEVTITLDTTSPTVSITSASGVSGSIVSTNTLRYTATFSEAVTGFVVGGITVAGTANGGDLVASNLQGAGAVYTFDVVRGSTDGTVTVSIAADVAKDDAGNDNTVSNDHTLIIDTTSPAVIITSGSGATNSTVNADTLSYTATFSMIVDDFVVGDITVAGTANGGSPVASNLQGTGAVYTFDVARGNSDGTVIVSIAAEVAHRQDGLGNIASNLYMLTIDTIDPTKPVIITQAQEVNTARFTLRGTADADVTTVELFRGISLIATIPVTNGAWEKTVGLYSGLNGANGVPGANEFTARAIDAAGNTSARSKSVTITRDAAPSIISITSTAQSPTLLDSIPITVLFSEPVTGFDSSSITVTNGSIQSSGGSGASYTFSITPNADGTITIIADIPAGAVVDDAGNPNTAASARTAASSRFTIESDRTKPGTVVISTEEKTVNTALFTLIGSAEVGSTVNLLREGTTSSFGSATATNGSWTITVTLIEEANTITATATDAAGNVSEASTAVTITLDQVAPTVAITTTAQIRNEASFTLTGTVEENATVDVLKDSASIGSATVTGTSWSKVVMLTDDGANAFTVTATDVAGNTSAPTAAVTITLDQVAPTVAITTTAQIRNEASFTLTGTVEANATVDVLKGGTSTGAATVTDTGWTFAVTLTEGANAFTVTATDDAGNTSDATAAVSITLDTVAPAVTITITARTVNEASFTLAGTVEAGATVDVFKDDTSIGSAIVSDTDWTFDVMLIVGFNTFTVTATDDAGNTSTATVTITRNPFLAEAPVITAINTVPNNAGVEGIICITFDGDVKFGTSTSSSFLTERLGDFVVSSDTSPTLRVTAFAGHCSVSSAIQLTLNRQIAFGETATLSYTKTGDEHGTKGIRRDVASGSEPLADFSNKPIINNAIAPIEGLELVLAGTSSANQIYLSFGLEIVTTSPDLRAADFAVSGAASNPVVTAISKVAPSALLLTLDANIVGGETITLSYAKTMGSISGTPSGSLLADFTDYPVANTLSPPAAPSISISPNTVTVTAGTAIAPITITSTGGTVASYGINPAIDNGLMFDARTGTISGTPTMVADATTYTITATNTGGEDTATVAITVNAAPIAAPIISISATTVTATVGTAIADITIDSTTGGGGAVASYGIAPDIGNGLLFDATTGTISGTPDAVAEAISYTITATNSGGMATATVAITVNAAPIAAPIISISATTVTATVGTAIADITIDSTTGGGGAVASYGIAPDIGNGLLFDATTGTISGTPDAVAEAISYTITATNSGGMATATVAITVNAAPIAAPIISISATTVTATVGTAIADITIDSTTGGGGAVASYGIAPDIGNGLLFDATTGTISGTPDAVAEAISYTITATNSGGMATATVAITVNAAPIAAPIISISATTVTATVGTAIADITIDSTTGGGGAVASYGIAPDIGNGLLFDATTGTISGTPDAVAEAISYTITATNSGGMATATVAITVNAAPIAAPIISISATTVTATVGTAIADITIDSTTGGGGAVASYGIAPDIGNGLLFDATTGTISGTPDAVAEAISYTITATNSGGMATATVAITVNAAPIAAPIISISATTVTATVGTAIADITIDSTTGGGGAVASYGIAPDIGNGLLFDATTGTISGTPDAVAEAISYTITATNSGGMATATVAITVNAAPIAAPIISISATTVTATVGTAIADITIDSTTGGGGAVASYGIAPDIGNGLLFDATTGTISGTPDAVAEAISYTITATNSGGMATATVAITVNAAPIAAPIISISATTVTATVGTAIADITIDSTTGGGGAVASYGIAPDIGNGLLFDATTGTISGTPDAVAEAISYTITATNSGGMATATVAITVNAAPIAAPIISISATTVTATVGTAIADITIDSTTGGGGAVASYGIAPDIGNGLLFDATTGTISGTPDAVAEAISYTITATNSGGMATATVAITVNAAPIAAPIISISATTVTATVGTAIADITIDSTTGGGGAVASYGIAPDIGNGLLFDATTGTISGTPDAVAEAISYTITATNTSGEDTATVAITVEASDTIAPAAPVISTIAQTVNDAAFTLIGSAEVGSTVNLLREGTTGSFGSATAENGSWTITVTLTEGANTITATATDGAGNVSAASAAVTITLDATAPAESFAAPSFNTLSNQAFALVGELELVIAQGQHDVPTIITEAQTVYTKSFTLNGTAGATDTVQLLRAGVAISSATATATNGSWTITITLNEGANEFTAMATSNTATSNAVIITFNPALHPDLAKQPNKDILPNDVPTIITEAQTVYTKSFTLNGTAGATDTVQLLRAGVAISSATATATNGSWTITITLNEGANEFTAMATSNTATSNAVIITFNPALHPDLAKQPNKDILPNDVPTIITEAQTVYTESFTLNGTAGATDTVQLLRAGMAIPSATATATNGSWTITVTLNEGANEFTAMATSNTATSTAVIITFNPALHPDLAKQLNKDILPNLVQTMLASTMAAVSNRIDAAFSGSPQAASYQFDGQTVQLDSETSLSANLHNTVEQKLPTYIKALQDDTLDWKRLIGNSSFVMPLNALDENGGNAGVTVWGSGDYSNMSDTGWKGDVLSFKLGVDQRMRNDLLVGGLVSWSEGDVDYTLGDKSGKYTHQVTSIHPYMSRSRDGVNLWGSVGYGQGELSITKNTKQGNNTKRSSGTKLLSLAAGVSGRLSQYGQSNLNLKSDIALAQTNINGSEDIPADKLSSQRLRLLLEIEQERQLASGGRFNPLVEVGLRYDGVDDSSDIGAVLGFGGRYANTTGLTIEGKFHTLVGRKDYKEWGVQGVIRQQSGANDQGLTFSLSPSYGATGKSANQVWNQKLSDGNNSNNDSARLELNMGYGLFTAGGLLTPYSEVSMGKNNRYRLGLRWKPNSPFSLHLYGERKASSDSDRILLESHIRF